MSEIFVSYRRDDSGGWVRALYQRLHAHFGGQQLFFDVEHIHAGDRFPDEIRRALDSCKVVLAAIGKSWLSSKLLDPGDYVRLEITRALERNIPIVPVLIGGQLSLPDSAQLPDCMKHLLSHQVHEISETRFDDDTTRLIRELGTRHGIEAAPTMSYASLVSMERAPLLQLIRDTERRLQATPASGSAYFQLGLCHLRLGAYPVASKALLRSTEVDPSNADAHYYLALALIGRRRPQTLSMNEVRRIEGILQIALQLDDQQAKYDYLLAILRFDYYLANGLKPPVPGHLELLERGRQKRQDPREVDLLLGTLPLRDQTFVSRLRQNL